MSSVLFCLLLASAAAAPPAWVKPPAVEANADRSGWQISFELDRATDVEAAVLNAEGRVVRHLAAGVLGAANAPPPPLRPGLSQRIPWNGKDDYGEAVDASNCSIRVRAGMGVALRAIVGGDPYAYYSKDMGSGDHAAWRMSGLEIKPDGSVYVLGNADNYGPPALRQYDLRGNYLRTVFPPPAGKPIAAMQGWGLYLREDATYSPHYGDLASPAITTVPIGGVRGHIARLVPSPEPDRLWVENRFQLLTVNTDGTRTEPSLPEESFVREPPLIEGGGRSDVVGPMQTALVPGGKYAFLSGIFAGTFERSSRTGAAVTGFWRDGQIFKLDLATRKAEVFFALPETEVIGELAARSASPIADFKYGTYAALQGVAVDGEGRVFVCDRRNRRVLVLDAEGKPLREIPLDYPDAIGVHPKSRAIYVTTRTGHYHQKGALQLHKFDDWSRDDQPSFTAPLCEVQHYDQRTHLAVGESNGEAFVWIAYTALPVRIYRDVPNGLELVKDFDRAATQRALDLQHFVVDPVTESVYVADGFNKSFRLRDWADPRFEPIQIDSSTRLKALSLAIDPRRRFLYAHDDRSPVARYQLDGEFLTPAPPENSATNAFTPEITNDWNIGLGKGDRGIAVAPDGSLATMNALGKGPDYAGYLRYYPPGGNAGDGMLFQSFNKVRASGVRFDLLGHLYAAKADDDAMNAPHGFEKDQNFAASMGRIYKFQPTGVQGNLYPTDPGKPAKVYDVHFGVISPRFTRTANFAVDGYGRIYYPTSLLPRVSVVDNEGNGILSFGTYGNRDSLGGLPGDLVPVADVPLAWPNCVEATDDFLYVSDIVNIRLMRLAKTFALSATTRSGKSVRDPSSARPLPSFSRSTAHSLEGGFRCEFVAP